MSKISASPGAQAKSQKALIDGLTASPPANTTSVLINNVTFTLPELLAKLSGYHATYDAAAKAETARAAAVQEREAVMVEAAALVAGARTVIKGMLGRHNPALSNFGITPDKEPTPLTAEQKVARAAKAKATRVARHTMGKKQKAKIH